MTSQEKARQLGFNAAYQGLGSLDNLFYLQSHTPQALGLTYEQWEELEQEWHFGHQLAKEVTSLQ